MNTTNLALATLTDDALHDAFAAAYNTLQLARYALERFEMGHARELSRAECARGAGDHATWSHAVGDPVVAGYSVSAAPKAALRAEWARHLPLLTERESLRATACAALLAVNDLSREVQTRAGSWTVIPDGVV